MGALVISLDFEMFWGVSDSKTVKHYGGNVLAEWDVVPATLKLFQNYNIHATWATVGMLLCKDYAQWSDIRPTLTPTYVRENCSNYAKADLVRNHPELFFARELVEQISNTGNQELASHTYSHFFCAEDGVSAEQFASDLECAQYIFDQAKFKPTSLVWPRNQVREDFLEVLPKFGINAYRGNPDHWLYRHGHLVTAPSHSTWRLLRIVDSCISFTGHHNYDLKDHKHPDLLDISASQFLRPITNRGLIDDQHLHKIKKGMLQAAKTNTVFHLWWHPHNFGMNTEVNLLRLESLLKYFNELQQKYGMLSMSMNELEESFREV